MDAGTRLRFLESESQAILACARASIDAPIEACPGWTMADLLRHVGSGQRWIEAALRQRATDQGGVEWGAPGEGDDLVVWFEEGLNVLLGTARSVVDEAPMRMLWNGDGVSGSPDFLRRRATNEAAIHRWDAQRAVGHADDIPAELALDCLDELLLLWLPWAARVGRQAQGRWSGESIGLRTSGRRWTVTFAGTGDVHVVPGDGGRPPDAEVEAPPSAMALFAMNRAAPADAEMHVSGDEMLLARWSVEVRFGSRTPAPSSGG